MIDPAMIDTYINELVSTCKNIELLDFLKEAHTRFVPDQDISFMEYFLELCNKKNYGKYIISHNKLVTFGAMTSTRGSDMLDRLNALNFVENKDYIKEVKQVARKQGGYSNKHIYHLTPRTFKLCLIRAKREPNQPVDVCKYADYYLFIEQVMYSYQEYQSALKNVFLSNRDAKIDSLKNDLVERDLAHKREQEERDLAHKRELENMFKMSEEKASKERLALAEQAKKERNKIAKKAAKERAELLGEVKDMHDTVIQNAETLVEVANRSAPDVPDAESNYFAMTAYQLNGDTTGRIYFRTWRTQASRMIDVIIEAMTDDNHILIIPPVYSPGSIQVGVKGKENLKEIAKSIQAELNASRPYKNRLSIPIVMGMMKVNTSSLKPSWAPNKYITEKRFIDCFLNAVLGPKMVKLSTSSPELQTKLDAVFRRSENNITQRNEESRAHIENIVEHVRNMMMTPPASPAVSENGD